MWAEVLESPLGLVPQLLFLPGTGPGALPVLQGLREIAEAVFNVAATKPNAAHIGLKLLEPQQILASLRVPPLGGGDQSQAVKRAGVVGGGVERGVEARVGVLETVESDEHLTKVGEQVRVTRGGGEGVLEACGGERKSARVQEASRQAAQVLRLNHGPR